jgi:hypothetical protein
MMGVGSVRDLPTFGGDLLLNGWNDDESNEDHEARVRYREQTSGGMLPKEEADAVVAAIGDLLQMVHVEGSEMPYVAQHLKDRVAPLLRGRRDDSRPPPRDASGAVLERRVHRRDVLHEVMEWDERHARMTRRRKTMVAKIDAVSTLLERERADHPDLPVTAALANAAADAETDEALDDVDAKLALRFDEQLVALSEREAAAAAARGDAKAAERTLRPLNRTQYAHHVKKGLRDLLPLYGAYARVARRAARELPRRRGGERGAGHVPGGGGFGVRRPGDGVRDVGARAQGFDARRRRRDLRRAGRARVAPRRRAAQGVRLDAADARGHGGDRPVPPSGGRQAPAGEARCAISTGASSRRRSRRTARGSSSFASRCPIAWWMRLSPTPKPRTCSSSPRLWRTPGTRCGARRSSAASGSTW